MGKRAIRVLIADDAVVMLRGLRSILSTVDDMDLIGEATSAPEAVRKVIDLQPDVVLMDLKWNVDQTAGATAIAEMKKQRPVTRIIAISAYESLIPDAQRAGADAALSKEFTPDQLFGLIRELAERTAPFAAPEPQASRLVELLSPREREVLSQLVAGKTNPQIAHAIGVSEGRLKKIVSRVLEKLNVKNRAMAAALGARLLRGD